MGQARHLVRVQRRTRVEDGQGGWTERWDTVARSYARVEAVSAGKRAFLSRHVGEVTHEVFLLHDGVRVRVHDRVLLPDGQRSLTVLGVSVDPDGDVAQLLAGEQQLDAGGA